MLLHVLALQAALGSVCNPFPAALLRRSPPCLFAFPHQGIAPRAMVGLTEVTRSPTSPVYSRPLPVSSILSSLSDLSRFLPISFISSTTFSISLTSLAFFRFWCLSRLYLLFRLLSAASISPASSVASSLRSVAVNSRCILQVVGLYPRRNRSLTPDGSSPSEPLSFIFVARQLSVTAVVGDHAIFVIPSMACVAMPWWGGIRSYQEPSVRANIMDMK